MKTKTKKKSEQTMSIKATSPFEELKWTIVDCREAVYIVHSSMLFYINSSTAVVFVYSVNLEK